MALCEEEMAEPEKEENQPVIPVVEVSGDVEVEFATLAIKNNDQVTKKRGRKTWMEKAGSESSQTKMTKYFKNQ